MAFCDYHACDRCGERKTFYDANMNVEWVADQDCFRYDWASEEFNTSRARRAYGEPG